MTAHPTGPQTSPVHDVADPRPSTQEHYDQQRRRGGRNSPRDDIGPNPARHDGRPKPRATNVETQAE